MFNVHCFSCYQAKQYIHAHSNQDPQSKSIFRNPGFHSVHPVSRYYLLSACGLLHPCLLPQSIGAGNKGVQAWMADKTFQSFPATPTVRHYTLRTHLSLHTVRIRSKKQLKPKFLCVKLNCIFQIPDSECPMVIRHKKQPFFVNCNQTFLSY